MNARIIRTCISNNERLTELSDIVMVDEPFSFDTLEQKNNDTEQFLINLHPEVTFDTFEGFGAALTEAAASVYNKMSDKNKAEFMEAYFSKDKGIGYTVGRMHIHSCDFSTFPYSYVEDGDMTLDSFDLSIEDKYVIPFVKDAMAVSPDIKLFASPWSPPPYMKDNNSWQGGYLKKECYPLWAKYIRKYVDELKKRDINLWGITVQNETRHHQMWESCCYTADQEAELVKEHLGPILEDTDVNIFVYDHCKERIFERCKKFYSDETLRKYIAGIACHWYSGDHFGEIELCRRLYPDKAVIMSEGCTYSMPIGFHSDVEVEASEKYAHDIIGDLNAGLTHFVDWNITLDENNGPCHWREGRNHCDAAIFCDTKNDKLHYHANYYVIGQFSKYIRPSAKRIGFSTYTSLLETTAFINPDGSIATVICNRTNEDINFILRVEGKLLKHTIPSHSVETILIED